MKIRPSIIIDHEKQVIKVLFVAYEDNKQYVIKGTERIEVPNECFLIEDRHLAFEFPMMFYREFRDGLQDEIDRLGWNAKPDDKEIKAVKEHLQDMRKLVFDK